MTPPLRDSIFLPFQMNVPGIPSGNATFPDGKEPSKRKSRETGPFGVGMDARILFRGPGCGAMTTDANPSADGRIPATPVSRW